eukprot:752723-Hanusia_phi.AAC.4
MASISPNLAETPDRATQYLGSHHQTELTCLKNKSHWLVRQQSSPPIVAHVAQCIPLDNPRVRKHGASFGQVISMAIKACSHLRRSENGSPKPAKNAARPLVEDRGADPKGYSEGNKTSESDDYDCQDYSSLAPARWRSLDTIRTVLNKP